MRQRVFGIEVQDRAECCQRTVRIAELKEGDAQFKVGGEALRVEFNRAAIERHRAFQVAFLKEHLGAVMGNSGCLRSVLSLSVGTNGGSKKKKNKQASHILCDSGSSDTVDHKNRFFLPTTQVLHQFEALMSYCFQQPCSL